MSGLSFCDGVMGSRKDLHVEALSEESAVSLLEFVLGATDWEQTPGQIQDTVESLHLSAGLGALQGK